MKRHFLFESGQAGETFGRGGVPKGTAVENQLVGQVDAEQINAWKQSHKGGIFAISNKTDIAYFKNPSRNEVNCALSTRDDESPLQVITEFADLLFIGGSQNMLTDDAMFLGVCSEIKEKMNGVTAKLVNL